MEKESLKIVIVGHVDHGKSTLIGRLLLDTDSLPEGKLSDIKRISKELGKDVELAYVTDQLKEERENDITIETTQTFFKTRKRNYCIIDAPGHVEFIKNMITGAAQADAAVLIIDVVEGVSEQTGRHAYLAGMLGLNNMIVLINKMDLVNYEEGPFDEVRTELLRMFDSLGLRFAYLIPVSAKEGAHISKRRSSMRWYKGPTFLKALDALTIEAGPEKRHLRFPVQDVYEIDGQRIIVGRVASGTVVKGQSVIMLPSRKRTAVQSIEVFGRARTCAEEGESVGMTLKGPLSVQRGDVIVEEKHLPAVTTCIKGTVFWMSDQPLKMNGEFKVRLATQEQNAVIEKIEKRMDSSTFKILEEEGTMLAINETACVTFKLEKEMVTEKFSRVAELGRFVIERDNIIQGTGIL